MLLSESDSHIVKAHVQVFAANPYSCFFFTFSGQWWWYTTFTASFGIPCHVYLEQLAIQKEMLVATNRRERFILNAHSSWTIKPIQVHGSMRLWEGWGSPDEFILWNAELMQLQCSNFIKVDRILSMNFCQYIGINNFWMYAYQ